MATHEVTNQVPPLSGHDVADDPALLTWVDNAELHELGRLAGSHEWQERGRLANAYPPVLHTHDRYGNRIDEVEFHPAWHELMNVAVSHGLHAYVDGEHLERAAKFYVWSQVEAGHGCPISMTCAAVPALRVSPELAATHEPLLTARTYDFGLRAPLTKSGLIAGMSMTEKQGGSDVRTNTTVARPVADGYVLTGHKWFTSAPMSDVFLTLAQAPGGLTCFLVPRVLPDGTRNRFFLQRLKDKLGNRSNASAEIEYDEAFAHRVGDEGRGVRTIIEMVNSTRLDCVLGTAAGMRLGLRQAAHHAAHRTAFGARLVDQPAMRNVLADLAIESEAATTTAMWLARHRSRLGLAVTKYWVCKRGPAHAAEALECLGGNGYIEDSGMPRLLRESPLMSIWEGSGNVAALDVLRAVQREPESVREFLDTVTGVDRRIDDAVAVLGPALSDVDESQARRVVERMALVLQGALLVRHGHPAVAEAFLRSRLGGDWGVAFGTLPRSTDFATIIERAVPQL
ncbi:putative acyl-CoA dehydrogenase [Lentzea xinjiangensis]|uniref:Putative acyl-CoA dehydrogenase n=1 Tax=Lentzea xinjiangensis TaxID=402600 RepID=A0A1H9MPP6_9PSEU|nr:acyl-CoA dehydrogenase family protein [Lentzea xinjiangensis]SER25666.1 putative acyl-CoA dehydrogenase [Lentzea xinjiangensis]